MDELKRVNKILNIELAIILVFITVSTAGAFYILYKHSSIMEEIMAQTDIGEEFWTIKDIISQQNYYGDEFQHTGKEEYAEQFLAYGQQFDNSWEKTQKYPIFFDNLKISEGEINSFLGYRDQFQIIYSKIFDNIRQNGPQQGGVSEVGEPEIYKNKMEEIINQWQDFNTKKILNLNQNMGHFLSSASLGIFIFFLFLAIGFALVSRRFFAPFIKKLLVDLTSRTKSLEDIKESLEEAKNILEIRVNARTKELEDLAEGLENQVQERTKNLREKIEELERFQKLTLNRELKMVDLKKEIADLKKELEKNKPNPDNI
ncbi:MAG: hypothetical protein Q7R53_00980 [bacterium]|nr:hypothetical protein [bacterium]